MKGVVLTLRCPVEGCEHTEPNRKKLLYHFTIGHGVSGSRHRSLLADRAYTIAFVSMVDRPAVVA